MPPGSPAGVPVETDAATPIVVRRQTGSAAWSI